MKGGEGKEEGGGGGGGAGRQGGVGGGVGGQSLRTLHQMERAKKDDLEL